jgi:hypothetical protein
MANRVYWAPSTDANIYSYLLETAAAEAGPWSTLTTILHSESTDATKYANGRFFYDHVAGTSTTWYRVTAIDSLAQSSSPYVFQVGEPSLGFKTEVDICNMALLFCGSKRQIASLSDVTPEAQACSSLYSQTRDFLLTEIWWPFATKRETLTALTETTDGATSYKTRSPWGYMYLAPLDMLTDQYVNSGMITPTADARIPYSLEPSDAATRMVILCNELDPELVYTAQVTATTLFPSYFVDALAWRLATNLILPLSMKPEYAKLLETKAEMMFRRAAMLALRHGQEEIEPDSEFVRVRA